MTITKFQLKYLTNVGFCADFGGRGFSLPSAMVIRSDGTMGGFSSSGGIILKKKLLNFENSWKQ